PPVFLLTTPPTTARYPPSLHDALPIYQRHDLGHPQLERHPLPVVLSCLQGALDQFLDPGRGRHEERRAPVRRAVGAREERLRLQDRKSTRLNSSHVKISYAVFCLKKKR